MPQWPVVLSSSREEELTYGSQISHKPRRSGVKLCPGLTEATVRKRD